MIDTNKYKNRLNVTPNINIIPLLDVIFTIMIFLLVMLSQQPTADTSHVEQTQISGKPVSASGTSEYYLMPVSGLKKVVVNGVDKSNCIRNQAIAIHTRAMDEGQVNIDSKTGTITIQAPDDIADIAVKPPSTT